MNRIVLTILLAISISTINAQKNSFVIGIYQGSPSLFDLESHFLGDYESEENARNTITTGASGFKLRYHLFKRLSFGIEANYSLSQYSTFLKNNEVQNSYNVNGKPMNYSNILTYKRFGIIPELGYHFNLGKKVKSHFLIGVGYRMVQKKEQSTFLEDETPWIKTNDDHLMSPMIARISWGIDYHIADSWSISSELGVGGGYVASLGINYYLSKGGE